MNNKQRRAIVDEAKSKGYQGSYIDLFRQASMNPEQHQDVFLAGTPTEKKEGLRPLHEAGRTDASMAFTDVPPNTPFNTMGMRAPIDIKKYDKQGHLVKSYENVPPGIRSLDTGPNVGTVLETPARRQGGGFKVEGTTTMQSSQATNPALFRPKFTQDFSEDTTVTSDDGSFTRNQAFERTKGNRVRGSQTFSMTDPQGNVTTQIDKYRNSRMMGLIPPRSTSKIVYPEQRQTGGYNPGEYMNEMQPKVFPNQQRDAQWVNYATEHDFAGRLPGETRTNEQIGLERSNRNTVPLPPNPTGPKELKRAQEGGTVEPEAEPQEEQSWGDYLGFNNPQNVTNYVNPFSNLFAPRLVTDEIKTRITDNIQPHGYEKNDMSPVERVKSAVIDDIAEPYSNRDMQEKGKGRSQAFRERTDLYKMMLGLDQVHNSIEKSEYTPTKGDPDKTYYKSNYTEKYIRSQLAAGRKPEDLVGVGYHSPTQKINVLGNFTIDQGEDEKGRYISYYDRWDLNPISDGKKGLAYYAEEAAKAVLGLKGPEVYGRVYYNYGGYRRMKHGGFKSLKDRRQKSSGI